MVFDITNKTSLKGIQTWLQSIASNIDNKEQLSMVLVGNKADLEEHREIEKEKGDEIAASLNVKYYECSASSGLNVDQAFRDLSEQIMDKYFPDRNAIIKMQEQQKEKIKLIEEDSSLDKSVSRVRGCCG